MTDHRSLPIKCGSCQAELTSPIVCAGCHTLYPAPPDTDYFSLLGIERRFDLDDSALASAFRSIARSVHPDRFATQPEALRALATRLAAEVNKAYQVLKDPVARADYLLELAGGPSAAQERGVPGDLLMEVMELREQLEHARSLGDRPGLERMQQALRTRRKRRMEDIAQGARSLDGADPTQQRHLRRLLNSIKYFDNLLAELA